MTFNKVKSTDDVYCSICAEGMWDDHPLRILDHVMEEHFNSIEFQDFVDELVVRECCAKCGSWYWSDVQVLNENVYGARPYCPDCGKENSPLKDLLTEKIYPRELIARALVRPEYAERSRRINDD